MAEFIDREEAKAKIREKFKFVPARIEINEVLNSIPAADVRPVVRGRWVTPTVIGGRTFNIPHYSVRNGVPCGVDEHTKYCPNCGAWMEES